MLFKAPLRFVLMILALALGASTTAYSADASRVPAPVITKANGDKCVKPVDDMRRNHMEYILHQRDETMRRGIRTTKYSLKECIDCHANKGDDNAYLPINAPGQFCQSCHSYASVKIDCFECHATKPEKNVSFHPVVTPETDAFRDVHVNTQGDALLNKVVKQQDTTGDLK